MDEIWSGSLLYRALTVLYALVALPQFTPTWHDTMAKEIARRSVSLTNEVIGMLMIVKRLILFVVVLVVVMIIIKQG